MIGIVAMLISIAVASDSTSLWTQASSGVTCGITVSATTVRTGETVSVTFVVSNGTQRVVSLPVPDTGTLSFNTVVTDANRDHLGVNGHTALAAIPGRRDFWREVAPGKSLAFTFFYAWKWSGANDVYLAYYSRFEDAPFKTMDTPRIRITVTN